MKLGGVFALSLLCSACADVDETAEEPLGGVPDEAGEVALESHVTSTPGVPVWTRTIPQRAVFGPELATDRAGNTIIASEASFVDFGGGLVVDETRGTDGYAVKYSPTGTRTWVRLFSGLGTVAAVASDAGGNIVLGGHGNANLGCGPKGDPI